jgi:uncharacterized glyoxalase superfamily protein PhnB
MTAQRVDQAVVPMLSYADGPAALDWLVRVFGFTERTRWLDADGRLSHGELDAFGGVLQLATPDPEYEGPRQHAEHCPSAARLLTSPYVVDGVLVHVPDAAAHRRTAEREGAHLLSGLETAPFGTLYRAEDLEGHRWMFLEPDGSGDAP